MWWSETVQRKKVCHTAIITACWDHYIYGYRWFYRFYRHGVNCKCVPLTNKMSCRCLSVDFLPWTWRPGGFWAERGRSTSGRWWNTWGQSQWCRRPRSGQRSRSCSGSASQTSGWKTKSGAAVIESSAVFSLMEERQATQRQTLNKMWKQNHEINTKYSQDKNRNVS